MTLDMEIQDMKRRTAIKERAKGKKEGKKDAGNVRLKLPEICWQMVWKLAKLQNLQSCPKKKLLRLRK
ncbi:MAG: hypothetical protein IJ601_04640 [Acidaminococcaceae bacterium]|nr:hypothetical protein [Acidaminococcaceae bacterium]